MKIISDNWSNKKINFEKLSFVHFPSANSMSDPVVIDYITEESTPFEIQQFFKNISKLVCSDEHRKIHQSRSDLGHFQFVLSNHEFPHFPVCWFTLVFDNGVEIKHDIAFSTTIVHKNGLRIFPLLSLSNREKWGKYTELKIKRRAYKFIGNQAIKD